MANHPLKNDGTGSGAADAARFLLIKPDLPDGSRRADAVFQQPAKPAGSSNR